MKYNPEISKRPRNTSFIRCIFFSFIILLIFTGILETVLRTTHLFDARISWSQPDPTLGWRYTPSRDYWYNDENDHPITGRINSYGWRDKDWGLSRPQNCYRIAVLGDSFVESFQVESDRTFLALTERQFNRSQDIQVELMNFGRSGFTQTEELLVLKNSVTQFSPDMTILFFLPQNDIQEISRETSLDLIRPFFHISEYGQLILDTTFVETAEFKIKCLMNRLTHHSALVTLLGERYNLYKALKRARTNPILNAKGGETLPKKLQGYLTLCTNNPDITYLRNFTLNKALIKSMAEYCKEKAIRFMLITIATPAYIPEVAQEYIHIDPTFNATFFEDDLMNFAQSINIEYLGLQRIFRHTFERHGDSLHWTHWNYQGHKTVADALTNKLRSMIPTTKRREI